MAARVVGTAMGMTTAQTTADRLRDLATNLAASEDRIAGEVAIAATSAAELRRQYRAADKRRGGPGSADARKYALGSALVLVGIDSGDDTALLGLMAHPKRMARWMQSGASAGAGPMFGDIVRWIFSDPARLTWCRQWGVILQWRRRAALYEQEVRRFIETGPLDPRASWRRKPITIGQAALIDALVGLLGELAPDLANRGAAFEWLRARGGNPTFWREPSLPPHLEEDDE